MPREAPRRPASRLRSPSMTREATRCPAKPRKPAANRIALLPHRPTSSEVLCRRRRLGAMPIRPSFVQIRTSPQGHLPSAAKAPCALADQAATLRSRWGIRPATRAQGTRRRGGRLDTAPVLPPSRCVDSTAPPLQHWRPSAGCGNASSVHITSGSKRILVWVFYSGKARLASARHSAARVWKQRAEELIHKPSLRNHSPSARREGPTAMLSGPTLRDIPSVQ